VLEVEVVSESVFVWELSVSLVVVEVVSVSVFV
jgi:hypothetical protein